MGMAAGRQELPVRQRRPAQPLSWATSASPHLTSAASLAEYWCRRSRSSAAAASCASRSAACKQRKPPCWLLSEREWRAPGDASRAAVPATAAERGPRKSSKQQAGGSNAGAPSAQLPPAAPPPPHAPCQPPQAGPEASPPTPSACAAPPRLPPPAAGPDLRPAWLPWRRARH